ncbi:MAG: DUF6683 family protein [Planctomycetota bacterium]
MFRFPLLSALLVVTGVASAQGDTPWRTRLSTLTQVQAPEGTLDKATLLRPELAFTPRRRWVLFPELAKDFATAEVPQETVLQVLEEGAKALREALAAERADKDLGVATALFVTQLWQVATGEELSEAQTDVVHAQVVQALVGPEVSAMRDTDKQRCWELCVGTTTFFAAMLEVAEAAPQRQAVRQAAGTAFAGLVGASAADLEVGPRGLRWKPGKQPAAGKPAPGGSGPQAGGQLPSSGPAIEAVSWAAPAGFTREDQNGTTIYRAALRDVERDGQPQASSQAQHQAAIGFLPVQTATAGPTALFERLWREQFAAFEPGETFVHYRGRLPSQLVVLYMGRFHRRPNKPQTHGNPDTYGALWLVDLGAGRFQPIVAVVEPRDPGIGMDTFKESAALQALAFPLGKVLDSVQPKGGKPPYPAGGYFAASDLLGEWEESSSAFGGSYYSTVTGGFAGVAVTSSSGSFALRQDGTYDYSFGYYAMNPQFGNSSGSTKHGGTFTLDGDVVLVKPAKPIPYEFTCCAVGIGRVVTGKGDRRVLVTVSKHRDGGFQQMPLISNGNACDSTLSFYVEKAK